MRNRCFIPSVVFFLMVGVVFADRPMGDSETKQILKKLTAEAQLTWISKGTIEAAHTEYRAPETSDVNEVNNEIAIATERYVNDPRKPEAVEYLQKMRRDAIPFNVKYKMLNEYTMNSRVIVKFDGIRFYWDIEVLSRDDSVKPGNDLRGNIMGRQFNPDWNGHRIFAWDGQEYVMYSLSMNHAVVKAGTGKASANGPLTVGLIPWGYGNYSYEKLLEAKPTGKETDASGHKRLEVVMHRLNQVEETIELDPSKDYAVVSYITTRPTRPTISRNYANYQKVSGKWIPMRILVSQVDKVSGRLLGYDLWTLTRIDERIPDSASFKVKYKADAQIEYYSNLSNGALIYRISSLMDPAFLLNKRLSAIASSGGGAQNCATVAIDYVASLLGRATSGSQLGRIVARSDSTTSLYTVKTCLEELGFHCRAVKTSVATLKDLSGCRVILHIPGKNHFVVLEGIDDTYIWVTDLTSNKFHYRTAVTSFNMDWTQGIALIVSNKHIQIAGEFSDIDADELHGILGGSGYQCTLLLQDELVIYCDQPVSGVCEGYFEFFYERWGCESAATGSCSTNWMVRHTECPCKKDIGDPYRCILTGNWYTSYIQACD